MSSDAPETNAGEARTCIVLFDGLCNLCNAAVDFILRRDRAGVFRFAALQSEAGRALLARHGLPDLDPGSMVLIEGGRAYQRSTAALRIARRLRFPWPLLAALLVIPVSLRDPVYGWIARNRYRLFGRRDSCRVPTDKERARFLGSD